MGFIGKISYSLYLWHWPIIVLFKSSYPVGSSSIFSHTLTLIPIIVLVSILSYEFIENPFRKNNSKFVFFALLIVMFSIGATSLYINKNADNFEDKLSSSEMKKF